MEKIMNKVILMGRLVKKDTKTIGKKKDHLVSNICIAVDKFVDGEKESEFFNITVWDKKADFIETYVNVGKRILVEGYLQIDEYEDEDENKHRVTKIIATSIEFADKFDKKEDDDDDDLPF
jgi:single-strand DNA-binding protein